MVWKDGGNYLQLDRGRFARHEIALKGCLDRKDLFIGRGRLPYERIYLRLERLGNLVKALCSADGNEWFSVGQVDFPVIDLVEVGLLGIGFVDRTIYLGAFPEGTAICFESFELWQG